MAPPAASSSFPAVSWRTRLAVLPLPSWWGLWVAFLSSIVLALGFFAVSAPDFTSTEFTVDQDLSRNHDGFLTIVAMVLDTAFSPVGGVIIIAATCLFLLLVRKSPVNAFAFGGVAAAGWLSSQLFKVVVERQRPNPALLFDPLAPETGSNSFPSGHVALAVGLAWACWFLMGNGRWSWLIGLAAVAVPVLVAWSRLYIGVHYPSDVAASFLAASAGVLFFAGVWNQWQGRFLPKVPFLERFGPLTAQNVADGSTVGAGPASGPTRSRH